MSRSIPIVIRATPVVALFVGIAALAFLRPVPIFAFLLAITATITGVVACFSYRRERLSVTLGIAAAALGLFTLALVLADAIPLILAYHPTMPAD